MNSCKFATMQEFYMLIVNTTKAFHVLDLELCNMSVIHYLSNLKQAEPHNDTVRKFLNPAAQKKLRQELVRLTEVSPSAAVPLSSPVGVEMDLYHIIQ